MGRILVEIHPVTNYIFHMLSAAGVGYDNEYGRRWRHTLPERDLAVLQAHARQLTVKGGEHCGEWYVPLICEAARGDAEPEAFFAAVDDPAMAEVCRVLGAHYRAYLRTVFPQTLRELQPYADELQRLLDESDLPARASELVGEEQPLFRVMLVNGLAGGAEAIDIGPEQDVFGNTRPVREKLLFIMHEYIIYLLKRALADTGAFRAMETWRLTEGLAQYYLRQLYPQAGDFGGLGAEIAFYAAQKQGLTARGKYLRAEAWALLETIAGAYREILGDALVGVYAHGSLAFGCYDPQQSDVDFLAVVSSAPDARQKRAMLEVLQQLDAFAPAKGFEMSVVLAADCACPQHPIPFSLHYSNAHRERVREDVDAYVAGMQGRDPDLAAHFTVTRAVGKAVWGAPVEEVFGEVPREAYLDSILQDVANAETDAARDPVYVILNLCRVLAFLREGAVLSKAQGGAWGAAHFPDEEAVARALEAYENGIPFTGDGRGFARRALAMIREECV